MVSAAQTNLFRLLLTKTHTSVAPLYSSTVNGGDSRNNPPQKTPPERSRAAMRPPIASASAPASSDPDVERFVAYMQRLQFPERCQKDFVGWGGSFAGYGSQIGMLFRHFINGLLLGKTTVVAPGYHGKHPYVSRKRCKKALIKGCVYGELSNCTLRRGRRIKAPDPSECDTWTRRAFNDMGERAGLAKRHSIDWYARHALRWLLDPLPELEAFTTQLGDKHFSHTEKTLCVHVRRGDRKESAQYRNEEYAAVINQATFLHGFGRVFLMSDDPHAQETIPKLIRLPVGSIPLDYFAVVNYSMPRGRQHAANIVFERQKYDPERGVTWDEALLFSGIFELWAKRCDGLVGNFKSSFPSIIYYLKQDPFEFFYDMDKGAQPSVCMNHMSQLPRGHLTHPFSGQVQGTDATGWAKKPIWADNW